MKTLTTFINPFPIKAQLTDKYEVIENEVLKGSNFNDLNVSGSLFSLTTFRGITFRSCVFFGSRMENCEFVDCRFEDCSFQFTTLEHCHFETTAFSQCNWDVSPIRKVHFKMCEMDHKTAYCASKTENTFKGCFTKENDRDWSVKFTSQGGLNKKERKAA